MISPIAWVIIAIVALACGLVLWCCVAINAPRTEEGKRRKFQEDCKEFDDYMAGKKGGKRNV